MADGPRVYWDSSVFLRYISDEEGWDTVEALMEDADNGKIEIITSVLTIAEVAWAKTEKATKALDPAVEAEIDKLWNSPSPVKQAEFHGSIAREARNLIRRFIPRGWSLKPYDSVHLSTAKLLGVDRIHTYEPGWVKYGKELGIPVEEPFVAQGRMLFPRTTPSPTVSVRPPEQSPSASREKEP